jgi:putative FmdB family regulatory protein
LPIFKYQCSDCGLRFDAMQAADGVKKTLSCKRCGKSASRQLSAASFKFAHRPDNPGPQNTGASSVDHDLDVIIGRSAAQNLHEFQRRQDYKLRTIAANETTGDHLSRLEDGEYFVMTEQERVAAKKARLANQEAMQRIKVWKEERPQASSPEAASQGSGR